MGFLVEKYILENIVRFSFEYLAQNIELQFTLCESPRPGVVQTSSKCQRCTFCTFPRACVCPWWWLGRKAPFFLFFSLHGNSASSSRCSSSPTLNLSQAASCNCTTAKDYSLHRACLPARPFFAAHILNPKDSKARQNTKELFSQ